MWYSIGTMYIRYSTGTMYIGTIQVQCTLFSRYPAAKLIIYTGDTDAAPDMILAKVQGALGNGSVVTAVLCCVVCDGIVVMISEVACALCRPERGSTWPFLTPTSPSSISTGSYHYLYIHHYHYFHHYHYIHHYHYSHHYH